MAKTRILETGLVLDERYRIVEVIGEGGMAVVYRARQERLGRDVAVKVIRPAFSQEPEFRRRFRQEAQALATLRHPNILQVHDFVATPEITYMVTEFLAGDTLDFRLYQLKRRGEMMEIGGVLTVAEALAQALSYAHQRGIIHRDIKPANVIFDADNRPVLTDFGISRLIHADVRLTAPEAMLGTPTYTSPEHARGERGDARADIYSLGVMLFEVATGRLPFESDNAFAMLRHHIEMPPPRPAAIRPGVPDGLEQIILKALAKHPELRYQSAAALLEALAPLLQPAEPALAPPPPVGEDVTTPLPAPPPPNNLPAELTSFVGRHELVTEVADRLRQTDTRLLTLTGPGGVGKTRLALRVAAEMLVEFPDGVFLVELATVRDAPRVLRAIEQALDVPEMGNVDDVLGRLKDHLSQRRMLLMLDNFEQALPAGGAVADLAGAAPQTRFLITSREILRVYGEQEFPVPPLPVPQRRQQLTAETIDDFPSLALFAARARAARPDFEINEENVGDVALICGRLDGLPLAIELAAARVRLLSPAAIADRLGGDPGNTDSFRLLRGGARNLPARQQTLRGAIDWSYALLDEAEQRLFLRLSAFVGGRTLDAIEEVCDLDGDLGLDPLDGLASLVDKSLLRQREGPDGEPTFYMLTTLFEYSRELLQQQPYYTQLRRRHAHCFRDLAERAEPHLQGAQQQLWLDRLEAQHDNVRAALAWFLTAGAAADACRMVAALWRFWRVRGYVGEGRHWAAEALAGAAEIADSAPYAAAVLAAGHLAYLQSDFAAAQAHYHEARTRLERLDDPTMLGQVLHNLGLVAFKGGDYQGAERYYRQSMTHLRESGDRAAIAGVLNSLGNLAWLNEDFPAARRYYGRSRQLWHKLGDKHNAAMVANNLGAVSMTAGDYESARTIFDQCLAIHRELNNKSGVALALSNLSEIALEQHQYQEAHRHLREALRIQKELQRKERIAILLEQFGRLEVRTGEYRRAVFLFGAAEGVRTVIQAPRPAIVQSQLEPDLERAGRELGKVAFAAAWARGRQLDVETAIAFALGEKVSL